MNRISADRRTSLTAVITKVKVSLSMTKAIHKKGSLPKESDLIALAKELDCSVMDFFAETSMSSCLWSTSSRTGRNYRGIMEKLRNCGKIVPFELLHRKKILEVRLSKR